MEQRNPAALRMLRRAFPNDRDDGLRLAREQLPQNEIAGIGLLAVLLERYGGDERRALAHYVSGERLSRGYGYADHALRIRTALRRNPFYQESFRSFDELLPPADESEDF